MSLAIASRVRLRLAYRRAKDDVTSVHEIAPIDIRFGDRPTTHGKRYLWAWCFATNELEMHAIDRVVRAIPLATTFDPSEILARWPRRRWPIPYDWEIPRDW